jgi:hypothetical protein
MEPRDLQSLVDAGLRRLPDPQAPRSLLPRVMTAIETERAIEGTRGAPSAAARGARAARGASAWRRGASIGILVAAVAASMAGVLAIDRGLARLTDRAPIIGAVSAVTRLVWDALLQPAAIYALVAFLALLFASAVTWRMCSHVVLGGASQS